jgi:DNA (cytosine-5)-methyltransferase 1
VVSGKDAGTPVIDAVGREIGQTFGAGTRVRVLFQPGRIRIIVHPSDAAQAERAARLADKIARGEAIDTGAVCFGAGILDAAIHDGLAQSGIAAHLRFAVDIDGDALEHAMAHNPVWRDDTISVTDDVALVDPSTLPRVDMLIAGLICTAASRPGRAKQRSLDRELRHPEGHEGGSAFVHLIRFIAALNPAIVLLENVPLYASTAGYAALLTTLRTLGYSLSETVVASPAWGCIENRERLVMVATTGAAVSLDGLAPNIAPGPLAGVLEPMADDDIRWRSHLHQQAYVARDLAAGSNFRLQLVDTATTKIGTIGRGYSRDRRTEPHIMHPTDPHRSRLLTVTEHARVKRIPEHLVAGLGHMRGHQVLGQSIAYPPFVSVGQRVGAWIMGDRAPGVLPKMRARVQLVAQAAAPSPQLSLF